MKILGLNVNHGDSSASIIINGKVTSFIEEERINRIKHWAGIPLLSIKWCLKNSKIKFNDIDIICINNDPKSNFINKIFFVISNPSYLSHSLKLLVTKNKREKNLYEIIKKEFNTQELPKIIHTNHHKCHISQAFYSSKFKEAIGLSIDGMGDFNSCVISKISGNKYSILKKCYFPNSLGIFYSAFTQYLGFNNYGDEYKVMGLSAYGKNYIDEIENFIFCDKKFFFRLNLRFFNIKNFPLKKTEGRPHYDNLFSKEAINFLDKFKTNYKNNFDQDLAHTVQKIYEKYFQDILSYINNLGKDNLVFSGGCAQNSLANRLIKNFQNIKNVYIPPVATDAGTGLGAAMGYYFENTNLDHRVINNSSPYLGTDIDYNELDNLITKLKKNNNLKISKFDNDNELFEFTAKLIYKNNIVGWYYNKSENGPRALGNRSILANPGNPNIKDLINKKIKRRESFRPFAPSVLEDKVDLFFEKNHSSPYMNIIYSALDITKAQAPSIVHVDGTSRVQTVNININSAFYNLIDNFYKLSGLPMLLNTSFNENEPIVNSVSQAYDCFDRTDMDALILSNYVIQKNIFN